MAAPSRISDTSWCYVGGTGSLDEGGTEDRKCGGLRGVKEKARVGVGIGCTWSIPGREGWLRVAAAGGSHATRRAHPAAGRR